MSSPVPPESSSPDFPEHQAAHPLSTGREGRGAEWVRDNARTIGVAAAVAGVVAIGAVAWRSSEGAKAQRAEQAFYQASASAGGGPQAEQALRSVATRYAGTPAGTQAELLLAQSLYDQGKFQDGLAVLQRGKPAAAFADAVQLLRAAGLEGSGRPAEAAAIYERLASTPGLVARRRDELRASAGRAYQLAGDRTSAARVWRRIVADASGSAADEARVRLGELGAS